MRESAENALRVVGMQAEPLPLGGREFLLRFVQDERRDRNQTEVMCQSGEPHGFRLASRRACGGRRGLQGRPPVANDLGQRRI